MEFGYPLIASEMSEELNPEHFEAIMNATETIALILFDKSNDASDKLYADEKAFSVETFYNLIFLEPTRKLHSQVENVDDGTSDTFARLYSIKSVDAFEKLGKLIQKLSLEFIYPPTFP